MLLECFNCPKCLRPYDLRQLMRTPMHETGRSLACQMCSYPNPCYLPVNSWLWQRLNQPNVKRTKEGWVALGRLLPGPLGAHPIATTLIAATYDNYVQAVQEAVMKVEESLKNELNLDSKCTRCEKSLGAVKNRLVISCSSVLCPECYYSTEMHNDCHLCGEALRLHLKPGRELLEKAEAERIATESSKDYGCQDITLAIGSNPSSGQNEPTSNDKPGKVAGNGNGNHPSDWTLI